MIYLMTIFVSVLLAVPVDMGGREFAPESVTKAPQDVEETKMAEKVELEYRPQNDGCTETKDAEGNPNGFKCTGSIVDNKNYKAPYGGMNPATQNETESSNYAQDMIRKQERLHFNKSR